MTKWSRERAVDRLEALVETVESETMPVPVRELWVTGDVALGLDPVERLDVYLTKDLLLGTPTDTGGTDTAETDATGTEIATTDGTRTAADETDAAPTTSNTPADFAVEGVGETVRTDWAQAHPEWLRSTGGGYAAPEKCLAAHLTDEAEPIHLEICNASFEDNVTQRLKGALATDAFERILDPRGVCLWAEGQRGTDVFEQLRRGEYAFPPLAEALEMLGVDPETAAEAANAVRNRRGDQQGRTVRSDVV